MDLSSMRNKTSPSGVVEDGIYAILGLTVVAAVHADGRAHILGLPDSFFTPWHGVLYGSLTALVLWLAIMGRRAAKRSGAGPIVIPAGYRYAALGAVLFAAGGVADMIWHQIFGIEFGIDALMSPSHLLLFVGGGLLLGGPVVAFGLRDTDRFAGRLPGLLGIVGMTGVAAFALSFLSAFLTDGPETPISREPEGTEAHVIAESIASSGLGSFIVTSLVLAVPAVYLIRSTLWFPGALTVLVTAVAALASSLTGFQNLESVIAAFASGVVLDLVVIALRGRVRERMLELSIAAALPLVVWSGQLIARSIRQPLGWSEEMVAGVVMVSTLVTITVALFLGGRPRRDRRSASLDDVAEQRTA